MTRWTEAHAAAWYEGLRAVKGVNYVPSYAVNTIEWWQDSTWDAGCINTEMALAAGCGFTSVRCNLHVLVWEKERAALHKKIQHLLETAHHHGISVALCLFDDCNFGEDTSARLGPQKSPVPGVHNSRWVASPVAAEVVRRSSWPVLEAYTRDIIRTYAGDDRILFWDLYNEPGNSGMDTASLPLVEAVFSWARDEAPGQPCTSGRWRDDALAQRLFDLSDVITFHCYEQASVMEALISRLESMRRPILCTETIRRQPLKTFRDVLPVFRAHRVGWYSWGLVAGRQQTYLPWEVRGLSINDPWHWDLLHLDGAPYDSEEIRLIRAFDFA